MFPKIQQKINKGEYKTCINHIDNLIKKEANKEEDKDYLYFLRGMCYYKLQNYKQASIDLEKAEATGDQRAFYFRAQCYRRTFNFAEALPLLSIASVSTPMQPDIESGGFAKITCFPFKTKQEIKIDQAACFEIVGLFSSADKCYQDILDSDLETQSSHRCKALAYKQFGDLENAIKEFSKAINLEEKAFLYYERSFCFYNEYRNSGTKMDSAIKDINKAIKLSKTNKNLFKYYLSRGVMKREKGDNLGYVLDFLLGFLKEPKFAILRIYIFIENYGFKKSLGVLKQVFIKDN